MAEGAAIVVDVGSGFMKAGLSSENEPSVVFPSIVGQPRRRFAEQYPGDPFFTGEDAVMARHHLSFFYPVDHGHIEDWTLMDELWSRVFSARGDLDAEKHPVLITCPPLASNLHLERVCETLFDVFNVPELSLAVQGALSLYAVARTTGVALEIGEGVTQVVPCVEGSLIKEGVRRIDCGGQELTMYLQKLICNNGIPITTRDGFEYVRLMKEQLCYVALDPTTEDLRTDTNASFELPDGVQMRDGSRSVHLGSERFYCPEALFNPGLIDKDHPPLYDLVMEAFKRSPMDLRSKMLEGIVLSGGSSRFAGLQERLHSDLSHIIPPSKVGNLNVVADDNRLYGVWIGGKFFAELRNSQRDAWLTRDLWQEMGERAVQKFVFV